MNISSSILFSFKYYYKTHVPYMFIPTGRGNDMSALQQHSPTPVLHKIFEVVFRWRGWLLYLMPTYWQEVIIKYRIAIIKMMIIIIIIYHN